MAGLEHRLFPDTAERARAHDALTRALIEAQARVQGGP
jgi:hypothetical protein